MATYSEIADKIIATYEAKNGGLYGYPRFHWLVRLYRITGDKKYVSLINNAFLALKPKFLQSIDSLNSKEGISKHSGEFLASYKMGNPRKVKRFAFYQKNLEIPVYLNTLDYLFTLKSLGLEGASDIRDSYNKGINYFKNNDASNVLLSPEFVTVYPSGSANMIHFLAYLGISDHKKELLDISKKYWQSVTPESRDIWLDKIYALTHIIIAASEYYQKFVERKDFEWIFDFFEQNIDKILTSCSTDAITEVGLSFKLAGESENRVVNMIKDYLVMAFNEKLGFIAKKIDATIGSAEHRNILAVMVLKDFQNLYKGPNIGD